MATVDITDIDDDTYGVLRARAEASGRTLEDYVRTVLEREARLDVFRSGFGQVT